MGVNSASGGVEDFKPAPGIASTEHEFEDPGKPVGGVGGAGSRRFPEQDNAEGVGFLVRGKVKGSGGGGGGRGIELPGESGIGREITAGFGRLKKVAGKSVAGQAQNALAHQAQEERNDD